MQPDVLPGLELGEEPKGIDNEEVDSDDDLVIWDEDPLSQAEEPKESKNLDVDYDRDIEIWEEEPPSPELVALLELEDET